MLHHVCLDAEVVLIEGNKVRVFEEKQGGTANLLHIATNEQRAGHDAPHTKMGAFFLFAESFTNLEHIHIVVVSTIAVSREVEVLFKDAFHRSP